MQLGNPPTAEVKQRSPWNAIITLLVLLEMIAGVVLMATFPVWLAPPNLAGTVSLYITGLFLWIPLLIVLAIFGYRGRFGILIIIGAITVFLGLGAGGANMSKGAIQAKDCTSQETSPGQTEYTCKLFSAFGTASEIETLVFQGETGSSYIRKVSDTTVFPP